MSVSEAPNAQAERTSSPTSARERGRQATRARLREAGRVLFAERGLHGVTTHDIARAAEVAAGTFYLHFADKHTLFREIVQETVDRLLEDLARAAAGGGDIPQLVRAQAEAMVGFAEDNRAVIRMVFSADNDAAAVGSDVLAQLAARLEQGRRQRLATGDATPDIDPAVLGQAVVGMWARVLAWWCEDPTRVSRDALVESLTTIELSGTHRSPGAV